jgi:intracellular sulfur oxidation DsrE/DsrF family protein
MKTENKTKVIAFLNSLPFSSEIDFSYHLSNEDFENFQDIYDLLNDANAFQVEIIYYSNAMKFLSENDSSLRESLEIAHEFGYEAKNLNSELLASLLASKMLQDEFSKLEYEIESFIDELEENEEETENEN